MKYVYHFCAQVQSGPGEVTFLDGITETNAPVESMDRYRTVKSDIAKKFGTDVERLTLLSLVPLCVVAETVAGDPAR